jgi:hypothetical protein
MVQNCKVVLVHVGSVLVCCCRDVSQGQVAAEEGWAGTV